MDGAVGHREAASSRAPSRTSTTSSHSHRYHHAHCGGGSRPVTPQVSSFLQERIQRRQAERRTSSELSTSNGSVRDGDALRSPVRRGPPSAGSRTRSLMGDDDRDGMGLKEMEKVRVRRSGTMPPPLLTPPRPYPPCISRTLT